MLFPSPSHAQLTGSCHHRPTLPCLHWPAPALARRTVQDAWVAKEHFLNLQGLLLLGVFDGHGPHGRAVACELASRLPGIVAQHAIGPRSAACEVRIDAPWSDAQGVEGGGAGHARWQVWRPASGASFDIPGWHSVVFAGTRTLALPSTGTPQGAPHSRQLVAWGGAAAAFRAVPIHILAAARCTQPHCR